MCLPGNTVTACHGKAWQLHPATGVRQGRARQPGMQAGVLPASGASGVLSVCRREITRTVQPVSGLADALSSMALK